MTSPDLIDLGRTFSQQQEEDDDTAYSPYRDELQRQHALTWSDVLKYPVTLVTGQAGSGKTSELELEERALRGQGQPVFFLRLETIAARGLDFALGEWRAEFDKWLGSNERAFLLLDSVDEAQATRHDAAHHALQTLLLALGTARRRATFVISSRPTFLGSATAFDEILQDISVAQARTTQENEPQDPNPKSTRRLRQRRVAGSTSASAVLRVRLLPLSSEQATKLARHYGVTNPETLMEQAASQGIGFVLENPASLRWLSDSWLQTPVIGTLTETVDRSVQNLLGDVNPVHEGRDPAPGREDLYAAACTLAAATLLTKTIGIGVPSVDGSGIAAGNLDPTAVLPAWKSPALRHLLSLNAFEDAGLGRVRFQQLLVRDYLAARWFGWALGNGAPLSSVVSRMLKETPHGTVAVLELTAVLGWLSNWEDRVRERVLKHAPQVAVFFGDFASLPDETQERAVRRFLTLVQEGLELDWVIDESDFVRVARPHLAQALSEFLDSSEHNEELERFVLRLVKAGRLTACQPAVRREFDRPGKSDRLQAHAVSALAVIGSPADIEALKALLRSDSPASDRVVADICVGLFPGHLSVTELFAAIRHAARDESPGEGNLSFLLQSRILPLLDKQQLSEAVGLLVSWAEDLGPLSPRALGRSEESGYSWVQELLVSYVSALLNQCEADEADEQMLLRAAGHMEAVAAKFYEHIDGTDEVRKALLKHPRLRKKVLQAAVGDGSSAELPWAIYPGESRRLVAVESNDLQWLSSLAEHGMNARVRSLGWEFIYSLWWRDKSPEAWNAILRTALREKAFQRVRAVAHGLLAPIRRQALNVRATIAKARRTRANRQEHRKHVGQLSRRLAGIEAGADVGALNFLAETMQGASNRSTYSLSNWTAVAVEFGERIALAAKQGFMAAWRQFEAPYPAETDGLHVDVRVRIGLIGLSLAVGDGLVLTLLSERDVELATRYALNEMNGFPPWFDQLVATRPELVVPHLLKEVNLELAKADNEQTYFPVLQDLRYADRRIQEVAGPTLWGLYQAGKIAHPVAVRDALRVIAASDGVPLAAFSESCRIECLRRFEARSWEQMRDWFAMWINTDPRAAWAWYEWAVVESNLVPHPSAVPLASALREAEFPFKVRSGTPPEDVLSSLERMVPFFERHVRAADDIHHTGAYSPLPRDDAQKFRSQLPQYIARIPGEASRAALQRLAADTELSHLRAWLLQRVEDHDQRSAALVPWKPAQITEFATVYDHAPNSADELFETALARLDDIKDDLERGDFSNRGLLSKDPGLPETFVQKWLASRLRLESRGRYSVVREEEVDRRRKPDIRIHHKDMRVGIEVKPLSQGRYSYNELVDALKNQLVGQYLRDFRSRHGVLVLFLLEQRNWQLDDGTRIDFPQLLERLSAEARQLEATNGFLKSVRVVGIDCTPPAPPTS